MIPYEPPYVSVRCVVRCRTAARTVPYVGSYGHIATTWTCIEISRITNMKFLELQIYNSENYKYEIMRIPIMVYKSRIKGQGTTGAQLRIFLHPIL